MAKDSMTFKLFGHDVSASKAFEKVGKAAKTMAKDGRTASGMLGGALGAIGLAGAGAAAVAFGKKSVDAFEIAGKQSLLFQRYIGGSIEDASRLGHAFTMTGIDAETGARSLGILSKHLAANDKAAQGLGIALKDQNGHLRPMSELLPQISEKFAQMQAGPEKTALALKLFGRNGTAMLPFLNKGAAGLKALSDESDKLGTTLTGKDADAVKEATLNKRRLGESVKGLQISIGKNLLPVVEKFVTFLTERVVPAVSNVVHWMEEHKTLVTTLAAVIVPLVGGVMLFTKAMQIYKTVMDAAKIAQMLFNGTLLANPITWIIVGVVALVAALVLFFTKTELGRKIIHAAWAGIKAAIHGVVEWFKQTAWPAIKKVWDFIVGYVKFVWHIYATVIGTIIKVVAGLVSWFREKLWPGIRHVWDQIVDKAGDAVTWIKEHFNNIVDFFKALPGRITKLAKNMWNGIKDAFKGVINFLIDAWNSLDFGIHITVPDWVPLIGGKGFNIDDVIPDIPRLATGGLAVAPTLAVVGEAGPEAIVPLSRAGMGSTTINISPQVMPGTEDQMARAIVKALNDYHRRGGRIAFAGV